MQNQNIHVSMDSQRINELSFTPGGSVVTVHYSNGKSVQYNKVKYPKAYVAKILGTDPGVLKILIGDEQVYSNSAS